MVFNRLWESRAINANTLFSSGDDIVFGTRSGTHVTQDNVFQVNAVFSAVSLIANTISTLPVDAYVRRDGDRIPFRPTPAWVQKPDVDLPREAFYNALIVSLLLDGNAFVRVFSNRAGEVVNLVVLNPLTVEVKRNGLGRLQFTVQGEDKILTSEDIIFIPDMLKPGTVRGVSRVEALKENLGYAIALDKFAQDFFGSGSQLAGVIEFPGNLTGEQAQDLANGFDSRHRIRSGRGHRTGVLTGGAKFVQTQSDPERSMLVESKNQAIADVARAFSIPPHLLALPGTNTYASVEQNNLAWVTHGLRPIIEKLESAMTPLMARTPGGENAFVKFNFNGLLRADSTSRAQFYSTGIQAGYFAINDIRRWEDLRVYDDPAADRPRVPLANVNLDAADLIADEKRVKMAQVLVVAGYDPADALVAVGLDPIRHTGLPSAQLQQAQTLDPDNPTAVYEVE
jgi:HK97 family phage portal protein